MCSTSHVPFPPITFGSPSQKCTDAIFFLISDFHRRPQHCHFSDESRSSSTVFFSISVTPLPLCTALFQLNVTEEGCHRELYCRHCSSSGHHSASLQPLSAPMSSQKPQDNFAPLNVAPHLGLCHHCHSSASVTVFLRRRHDSGDPRSLCLSLWHRTYSL